ncbi:MAG: hypothetical protein NWF00_00860 [Candidatus Bathyarchaeota archaeon]|nr:hypothetical protein [Candidatus Bathyarchaeota archaeon]
MKTKLPSTAAVAIVLFIMLIPAALAHAPLETTDNESIETSTVISDPTKSWAIYAKLNSNGDPQYYTFNVTSDQEIRITLYKSMRPEDTDFKPQLVIMGPELTPQGSIPAEITVPSGYGAYLVKQSEPQPTYEPFSPGTFVGLAEETLQNPTAGQYYLVVYEQSDAPQGGNYGMAIGERETYSLEEWILIPFNLIGIYQWEGQSLPVIFAPMIATLIVGATLLTWQLKRKGELGNLLAWVGAIAGITFVGTAATTLFQKLSAATQVPLGAEAILTMIFVIIPLVLGLTTVRLALKDSGNAGVKKRIYFVILGVAALFAWAGLIVGPALAIAASVMPTKVGNKQ